MFVTEAALSAFFGQLFQKLLSPELLTFARRHRVDEELEEWRKTLSTIEAVVNDAEEKQMREKAVKMWLDDLKALAYDIEDVLDVFNTEAKRRSLRDEAQTSSSKVRKLIPTCALIFNKNIGEKMKNITIELDAIVKRKSDLHLREGVGGMPFSTEERLQSTSLVDETEVYGRDADKDKIIGLLMSDEATRDNRISVVPIVGMGGVGKTTLAQIIYNDERVGSGFDVRVWVCVSDQFDVIRITKAILESMTKRSSEFKNLEPLQDCLKNELNGKRFFLVLDDVWNENPNSWDVLQAPFRVGKQGSVILVTTRNEDVASIMGTVASSHHLGELFYEQCWLLFAERAFTNINSDACQALEPIGKETVRKCQGLPLVAKTLGSLLGSKQDQNAWSDILNSDIWDLAKEQSNILPALYLSYYYLPTKLKRCFAYCSLFPKDYVFEKKKLVSLWMAEGLVDDSKKRKIMEDIGDWYFHNLLLRSFFQQSAPGESSFVMHDMIHDLAQFVSGEFCFRLEAGEQSQIYDNTRHFSYIRGSYEVSNKFNCLNKGYKLRTFLPLFMPVNLRFCGCHLAKKVLHGLLPTLQCLRILCSSYYKISELPCSIGDLKHLRYLDLCHTQLRRLPQSISTLFNLQTLLLTGCHRLIELPTNMRKLINLRHLDIRYTSLNMMPEELNRLKNLQTLTNFVVGKHSGARIRELRDLSHIGGTVSIFKLQNVLHGNDALEANLKSKERLDELLFNWDSNYDAIPGDSLNQPTVLEKLQPHKNLKELSIEYYGGAVFPNWLGEPSFTNIVFLLLKSCKNCSTLPPLGQLPSLKKLWIEKIDGVLRVGPEFYGNGPSSFKPFGSLETNISRDVELGGMGSFWS